MSEWQPIETAPKDGTQIIAWGENIGHIVTEYAPFNGTDWVWVTLDGPDYHVSAFTHWMPLPAPPKGGSDGE